MAMISTKTILLHILMTLIAFLVIGEISFRLPGSAQAIRYAFDDQLGVAYKPNQVGVVFLGNYSVQSPPITINDRGFRGESIDILRPTILVCGSSEVVGPGVEDNETFSSQLELLLRGADYPHQVVNLGTGGHGAYHHSIVARRFVSELSPTYVIARVSSGDRFFLRPSQEQLEEYKKSRARNDRIREFTLFVPFLYNKLMAQGNVIGSMWESLWTYSDQEQNEDRSAYASSKATGVAMWQTNNAYWKQLITDSEQYNFQLIFLIVNPRSLDADKVLAEQLIEVTKDNEHITVLELDALSYGVEDLNDNQLADWYSRTYTLGYDPHSNTKHHAFISRKLFDTLREMPPIASADLP